MAALGVFLFHAAGVFPSEGPFGRVLHEVGRNGAVGVDFFFALSGFVLAWSWRPGTSTARFYRRRFARLAPAYWVALVYGLVWVVVLYREPVRASIESVPALLGLQAWFPDPRIHFAANGVEWSVWAEMFFYAVFPLLILLAARRRARLGLVALTILLVLVAPAVVTALVNDGVRSWALEILPPMRLGEFLAGLLLGVLLQGGRRIPVRPRPALALFATAYLLVPLTPAWYPRRATLLLAILLVIAALAQSDAAGRRHQLSRAPLVRLGEWSYCFYLVHQVTLQIALLATARVVHGSLLGLVWLTVALSASVALAALLHLAVERPFERRLRGADRRASRTADPDVASTVHTPVLVRD